MSCYPGCYAIRQQDLDTALLDTTDLLQGDCTMENIVTSTRLTDTPFDRPIAEVP